MTDERCLFEQMIGDFFFDGCNNNDFWLDNICLADVIILAIGELQ